VLATTPFKSGARNMTPEDRMSITNGGQDSGPAQNQAQNPVPQLHVLAQYIKDFSFENPNAPRSLNPGQQPSVSLQINVNANPLPSNDVEVELKLEGKAEASGTVMFSFDLAFAGVFRIQNVPQDSMHPLVMIECPRLLFPFAREIVASVVRSGGFPQFLIEPIDFVALYRQRTEQMPPQQSAPTA
jgi:preprotein translocase subunit SecB